MLVTGCNDDNKNAILKAFGWQINVYFGK